MSRTQFFGPGAVAGIKASPTLDALPRTALPVRQGRPASLGPHLQRLAEGAKAMDHAAPWVLELSDHLLNWLAEVAPGEDLGLRLALHPAASLLVARLEPMPITPPEYRLIILPHPLADRRLDPILQHKGLGGSWGKEILKRAQEQNAEDALLLWPDGTVAETAIASVGIESNGMLHVPPPQGRVASLAERLDLPQWAKTKGLKIETKAMTVEEARGGRPWCMNALRGIWPGKLL